MTLLFLKHSICLSGFFPSFLLSGMHILKNNCCSILVVFCGVRTHKLGSSTVTPVFVAAACFFVIITAQSVSIPSCWLISFSMFSSSSLTLLRHACCRVLEGWLHGEVLHDLETKQQLTTGQWARHTVTGTVHICQWLWVLVRCCKWWC